MKSPLRNLLVFASLALSLSGIALQHSWAKSFQDIPSTHQNALAVEYLSELEIFKGQGDGNRFNPAGLINRAEFAVILARSQQVDLSDPSLKNCFPDVGTEWYAASVCFAKNRGWIKGYQSGPEAGKFMPVNNLNTAEVLVIMDRVLGWGSPTGQTWYDGSLSFAAQSNILTGVPFDRPLTRAQVAEVLFRSTVRSHYRVDRYDDLLGTQLVTESRTSAQPDPNPTAPNTETSKPGQIIGQLSTFGSQPESFTIPKGSTNVTVLRFQIQVSTAAILDSLTINRTGAGRLQDLEEGRLVGNQKVLKHSGFNSEDSTIRWNGLNISLSPSSPAVFELLVDFSDEATPVTFHQFQIAAKDIRFTDTNLGVSGSTQSGGTFQISSIPVSTVTVKNPTGKLKLPFINSPDEIVARFIIVAGDHDVLVKRVRLRDAGTLSFSVFRNFRISAGSASLGAQASIAGSMLDFVISDHLIKAGESRTFTVQAEITGDANIDNNVRFYVQDETDIYAQDTFFGVGTRVNNQFTRTTAQCAGSETAECPKPGLRRRCSKVERDAGVEECVNEDTSSSTTTPTTSCSTTFTTSCGTLDGIRRPFPNQCDATEQGATNISAGACNPSICDSEPAPVCGRVFNGQVRKTFLNRCHADEYRAVTVTDGACQNENTVCASVYEPVCGSIKVECLTDNCGPIKQTFSNRCVAESASATGITEGECN